MMRLLILTSFLLFSCEMIKNKNKTEDQLLHLDKQEEVIKQRVLSYELDIKYSNDTSTSMSPNMLKKVFSFLDEIENDTILRKIEANIYEDNILFCIEGAASKNVSSKVIHKRIQNLKENLHLILGKYDEYRPAFKTVEKIKYNKKDYVKLNLNRLMY
ncbi:hypothetical protein [Aureispira anguillae]|uniref:Lipoprotein n=1 Tax=Aureispira anguillae TaxID=2864201 RepID=A0A915YI87_9BACT|nr:hypothetical protein [Aureispira anguillae]BDS13456.1 hypothetical protein AsAng_0041940 [Aureispira anguillae]